MSKLLLNTGSDALLINSSFLLLSADQDLRWEPHFPDRVPPKAALRVSSRPAFVVNIDPIVNPPLPTAMPPMPTFPAQVFRELLPRSAYPAFVSGTQYLGTDLRNRAVYPDRFPARRLRPYMQSFEIGGVLDVPKTGGWRPRYPDRIPRRLPVRTGMIAYQPDPSIFVTSGTCINWTDVDLVQPYIAEQVVTEPTITAETFVQPTIAVEGVC